MLKKYIIQIHILSNIDQILILLTLAKHWEKFAQYILSAGGGGREWSYQAQKAETTINRWQISGFVGVTPQKGSPLAISFISGYISMFFSILQQPNLTHPRGGVARW